MAEEVPFRLVLASGSPARRALLARAGYRFEVVPAGVEEPSQEGVTDVRALVQEAAWCKAAAVAGRVAPPPPGEGVIIVAADTVGWLGGRVLGKPADEADARRILRHLSGSEHELWTGVCLWRKPGDVQVAWQEMSRVAMRALTDAELDEYLRSREWQGCSGAYAIQEGGDPYVRVAAGSVSNVIGLPMETLAHILAWLGRVDAGKATPDTP